MTKSKKPLKASAQAFNIRTEAVSTVKLDPTIHGVTKPEIRKRLMEVLTETALQGA